MRCLLLVLALGSIALPVAAEDYDASGYSWTTGEYLDGEIESTPGSRDVEGYLTDPYTGEDIYVEGEWTGRGEAEVTDDYGNTYDIEVE